MAHSITNKERVPVLTLLLILHMQKNSKCGNAEEVKSLRVSGDTCKPFLLRGSASSVLGVGRVGFVLPLPVFVFLCLLFLF